MPAVELGYSNVMALSAIQAGRGIPPSTLYPWRNAVSHRIDAASILSPGDVPSGSPSEKDSSNPKEEASAGSAFPALPPYDRRFPASIVGRGAVEAGGVFGAGTEEFPAAKDADARVQEAARLRKGSDREKGVKDPWGPDKAESNSRERELEKKLSDLEGEKAQQERKHLDEASNRSAETGRVISQLKSRDAEVRTHESAHIAAGGRYITGGASYTYQKGPDGRQYAVGGEVGIDSSPIPGKPEETIAKMRIVRAAALAPAEPSGADLAVAGAAAQAEASAVAELARSRSEAEDQPTATTALFRGTTASIPSYERWGRGDEEEPGTIINLVA